MIDKLILRTSERALPRLYLVDSLTRAKDDPASCAPATVPIAPFQSPVIGWSLQQLREHYIDQIPESKGKFGSFTFIVLDNRTKKDETCRIVSLLPDYTEPDPNASVTARADFFVAVEVLIPVDVRSHRLNEGMGRQWREDDGNGEFLYTKERMIEFMGPEFNMRDYLKPVVIS
jgi:hypothetical protein